MRISRAKWSVGMPTGLVTAFTLILWLTLPAGAKSLTTEMVSISSAGEQGNGDSYPQGAPNMSSNERFVVFVSPASNLVLGDTNGGLDIFRHDRSTGRTIRVSVSSSGKQGNDESFNGVVSGDGNLVAFDSVASNLVPGDTNGASDVFVHNVATGKTIRVSVTSSGKQGHDDSVGPTISDDGRFVVFFSAARLVHDDTNRSLDVYIHDLRSGQTSRISVSSTGRQGNGDSFDVSISAGDGSDDDRSADDPLVAFTSFASNLVPGDTNDASDSFVHDLATGKTTRVSVSSSGHQANDNTFQPVLSADGRFVLMSSFADNLVRHDMNGFPDAFVKDLKTGKTTLVSVSSTGAQGNADTRFSKGISGDGRFVTYRSYASNLVPHDTNGATDVFLFDMKTGRTIRVSVSDTGAQGNGDSYNAGISENGRWVLFGSLAPNFVPGGDTNGPDNGDTFVRGPFGSDDSLEVSAGAVSGQGSAVTAGGSSPHRSACRMPTALQRSLSRLPAASRTACAM